MKLISALFLVLAPLAIVPAASATTHDTARGTEGIQITEGGANYDKNLRGPATGEGGRKLYYFSKGSPSKGSKSGKSSKSKGKGKGSKSSSYSW
jgi:hypothetical protein